MRRSLYNKRGAIGIDDGVLAPAFGALPHRVDVLLVRISAEQGSVKDLKRRFGREAKYNMHGFGVVHIGSVQGPSYGLGRFGVAAAFVEREVRVQIRLHLGLVVGDIAQANGLVAHRRHGFF